MAIDLTRQFLGAKVAAASHASQFGLPTIQCFTVAQRTENQGFIFRDIRPLPHIEQLDPKFVARQSGSGVEYELEDLRVSGIAKTYPLRLITGRGFFYIIGLTAEQMLGLTTQVYRDQDVFDRGGIVADLVPETKVEEQDQINWSLTLRRRAHNG